MFFSRSEMPALAADRDAQADRATDYATQYPANSSEARMAIECAVELRLHADQLRRGINPYEADSSLWIPRGDGR